MNEKERIQRVLEDLFRVNESIYCNGDDLKALVITFCDIIYDEYDLGKEAIIELIQEEIEDEKRNE